MENKRNYRLLKFVTKTKTGRKSKDIIWILRQLYRIKIDRREYNDL